MSERYLQLPGGRIRVLGPDLTFPPVEQALDDPNGLLAIGGDLSPQRLLAAYRHGIFPWFSTGQPILWWSPAPRMVLYPQELNISRSMRKRLKQQDYEVRYNTAFREVMQACAETVRPDQDGTWITGPMIEAYATLQELGHALSAETWIDGQLAGGLYGVRIGRMFFGESMFHRVSNASKIAFIHLVQELQRQGCGLIDCQMHTSHLASLGAREIPRREFCRQLAELIE
ncbi:MAG: leucyl/phenylalanyl-tRNA--protein transferase [Methylophilaceae bacterium]|jgi:leucyl/phenylalanyl-tRNA--protein transferase|nr:leucyl/phenylalanyl-tRNA--protein transferase [Methylophilaceae bacterium]